MENLNKIISVNLKNIRNEQKLSLDKVSEMTGVSKSMLGQIERGESNPTITTVWKIANGLKVSFTTLLKQPENETVIIKKESLEPMVASEGKYRLYPFFPYDHSRKFEMYKVEIDPEGALEAEPHGQNTYELVTVFDGAITIEVDQELFTVQKGDAIKFKSDVPHTYRNTGDEMTRVSMIIYYPEM